MADGLLEAWLFTHSVFPSAIAACNARSGSDFRLLRLHNMQQCGGTSRTSCKNHLFHTLHLVSPTFSFKIIITTVGTAGTPYRVQGAQQHRLQHSGLA